MTPHPLMNEQTSQLTAALTTFRAVREPLVQPTSAELNQMEGMGLVRVGIVEHENALHRVLLPGPGKTFAAYSGRRRTAPAADQRLTAALTGELTAFLLYGEVTLTTLAAAAENPAVELNERRQAVIVDVGGEKCAHAVWLRCPVPATVTGLLDAAGSLPVTIHVPHGAPGLKDLKRHAQEAKFTVNEYSVHAWPPR